MSTPESGRDPQPNERKVLNTTEARQGFRGRHVLWVLGISLGLIVAIYAVMVGGVWNGRLSKPGGQTLTTPDQAQTFHAEPSQPRQSENPQTTPTLTPAPTNGQGQGQNR
jgi:hypothetical protein